MAGKRGAQVALQTEINTDEEFEMFLERKGLLVIDVYSEWSGPCTGFVGNLKKIKVENGGDMLQLAIAKNDEIEMLKRFRGKSEPIWLFVSNGHAIRYEFGVNVPKLTQAILDELQREANAQAGNDVRQYRPIPELTPAEQVVEDELRAEEEAAAFAAAEEARRIAEEKLQRNFRVIGENIKGISPIIIWPAVVDLGSSLSEHWGPSNLAPAALEKRNIPLEVVEEWQAHANFDLSDLAIDGLIDGIAYIYTIKSKGDPEKLGAPLEKIIAEIIYGESGMPPGDEECVANHFNHFRPYPIEIPPPPEEEDEEEEDDEGINLDEPVEYPENEDPSRVRSQKSHPGLENKSQSNLGKSGSQKSHPNLAKSASQKSQPKLAKSQPLIEEPEEIQGEDIPGIWVPLSAYAKAVIMHTLFPKITTPFIPIDPEPPPPHMAIAFDATIRKTVFETMQEFPKEVLSYGFFSSYDAYDHKLLARNFKEFNKAPRYGAKLVMKIARKRSYPLITLASLGPQYVSDNVQDGEKECALFFPENFPGGFEDPPTPPPEPKGDEEEEEEHH